MVALTDPLAYQEFEKSYPPLRSSYSHSFKEKAFKKYKFFFSMLMAILLIFPKNKKFFFCFWGPYNAKSGNPGVVEVIAVDFLSSRILRVGRIEWE